jgi:hypothetical protein
MESLEKGTIITCENGHPVCELSIPVNGTSLIMSSDFTNFRGENVPPVPHDRIGDSKSNCYICGGQWIRMEKFKSYVNLHTEKGWIQ